MRRPPLPRPRSTASQAMVRSEAPGFGTRRVALRRRLLRAGWLQEASGQVALAVQDAAHDYLVADDFIKQDVSVKGPQDDEKPPGREPRA